MRRALIVLALLAVSLALSASEGSATNSSSKLRGHIIFTRAGDQYGDETLFVANADGTNQRKMTKIETCCPWATPTGSMVDFGGYVGNRITAVTSKLDGSDAHVLPLPKGTLSLGSGPITKNGAIIAREGFDDKHPAAAGIYLTRASDGTVIRRVTTKHFIPGDFSPNGKQLVVFTGPEGNGPPPPGSLWIVNTNGRGLRRLTPPSVKVGCCFNYRWSPDGTKILFADYDGLVWTIAPDGSKLTKVYDGTKNLKYAATPTWSPDGSMIMFALDPSSDPFSHPWNALYVMKADGTGLAKVLGGNTFKREPIWVSK